MMRKNNRAIVAIPLFRFRVAPVLNWCTSVFLIPHGEIDRSLGKEVILPEMNCFERLRILSERKVDTLICGALSADLFDYGRSLGVRIIHGIAGGIDEVLLAFRDGELSDPRFRMPGYSPGATASGKYRNKMNQ